MASAARKISMSSTTWLHRLKILARKTSLTSITNMTRKTGGIRLILPIVSSLVSLSLLVIVEIIPNPVSFDTMVKLVKMVK